MAYFLQETKPLKTLKRCHKNGIVYCDAWNKTSIPCKLSQWLRQGSKVFFNVCLSFTKGENHLPIICLSCCDPSNDWAVGWQPVGGHREIHEWTKSLMVGKDKTWQDLPLLGGVWLAEPLFHSPSVQDQGEDPVISWLKATPCPFFLFKYLVILEKGKAH